jgi:RNA-directed DNA polymerase
VTFSKLDHLIYWRLMRWGKRRHSRKTGGWVYSHYWKTFRGRKAFCVLDENAAHRWLYQLSDTKIVRHKKIKGEFNPFDPNWFVYGERLRQERGSQEIRSSQRLKLWMNQQAKCALCHQVLSLEESFDEHHIVHKQYGGNDALSNRVLLHPVCHRRVHALGLEVTKPVPA